MGTVNEAEIRYRILVLGDDVVTAEDKVEAVEVLEGAGKDAIPFLVERLLDRKDAVFLEHSRVTTGPLHATPDAVVRTGVRYQVETILYSIIAPERRRGAPKTKLDTLKPDVGPLPSSRPPIPWVADWNLFWRAHKAESLEAMRAWSAEEIERRWDAIDDGHGAALVPASAAGFGVPPLDDSVETAAVRERYRQARALFLEARQDTKKGSDAKRSLAELGKANARLKVHTDFMVDRLER